MPSDHSILYCTASCTSVDVYSKFGILKCLPSPPASATVNIHNGFFRNAELEHWKQLNTDLHESWKCTVPIKCIFDILASRGTHFLCSFTSPLSTSDLIIFPDLICICVGYHSQCSKPYMWEAQIFLLKKKMWTSHFDCILCAFDKTKRMPTVSQED